MAITKVRKRDSRIVLYDKSKIVTAITKAMESVDKKDPIIAEGIANLVEKDLEEKFLEYVPSVEDIQDLIENMLIKEGHAEVAKSFILYRYQRTKLREAKQTLIGKIDDSEIG